MVRQKTNMADNDEEETYDTAAGVTSVTATTLHLVARLVADKLTSCLQVLAVHTSVATATATPHQARFLTRRTRTLVTWSRTEMRLSYK